LPASPSWLPGELQSVRAKTKPRCQLRRRTNSINVEESEEIDLLERFCMSKDDFSAFNTVGATKPRTPNLSVGALLLVAFIVPVTEIAGRLDYRFANENYFLARSAGASGTLPSGIGAIWAINDSEKIDKDD